MGIRLIKIAGVYFVIAILLGMYMSMSHEFQLRGVHTHLNLVGWVSLALAGIFYHLFPAAAATGLAKVHFWLHNIGLPVMMLGLWFVSYGNMAVEWIIPLGAIPLIIGIILFVVNLFRHVK
ncbi:cytochrome-c oxidase [Brevibacillus ruminantium]|uniref:Cytochrome-c oxidase n=1 Tax=Brevibacillus ruminantium TaxID=2950604 RepID=A0ABY4WJE8_9BACL|nr:cytochrome-c oxidase [Brevibacillus ruminantium]USG66916.1 cytochrome-c oxidase [Brevibacillus ruminantium]